MSASDNDMAKKKQTPKTTSKSFKHQKKEKLVNIPIVCYTNHVLNPLIHFLEIRFHLFFLHFELFYK